MKLVSVHPSPAPYTTPVLNALAKRLDLHAFYFSGEDRVSRFADSWGAKPEFDHSVVRSRRLEIRPVRVQAQLSLGLARRLGRLRPDVVLVVSWQPTSLEPLLWTRWSGSAAVMWSESTEFSGVLRGSVSSLVRRWMLGMCDGYVTSGTQAARYLESLGVPGERVVASRLPAPRAPTTTARLEPASGEDVRFLFVGRLVPSKRPLEAIEAFRAVRAAVPAARLTVVGGGELEDAVRDAVRSAPGVEYVGWREGEELASLYATSDVLVMPAVREVWGVVVNEALAHGLYVVATDQVGSAFDLLDDENGTIVPAGDLDRLAPSLVEAARTVDRSDEARRRRAAATASCTPERLAADIHRAAELAVGVRRTRWRARGTERTR